MRADDLALDVFVDAEWRTMLVLDEDEFAALELPEEQQAAWEAVEAIRRAVAECRSPFEQLTLHSG